MPFQRAAHSTGHKDISEDCSASKEQTHLVDTPGRFVDLLPVPLAALQAVPLRRSRYQSRDDTKASKPGHKNCEKITNKLTWRELGSILQKATSNKGV